MKICTRTFDIISYGFFFFYFVSYIGGNTTIKYVVLGIYQIFLLFYIKKNSIIKENKTFFIILSGIIITLLISLLIHFEIGGAVKTLSLIDLFIFTYYIISKRLDHCFINEEDLIIIITNSLFISLLIAFVFYYNDVSINIWRNTSAEVRHLFGFGYPSIVGFLSFIEVVFSFYLLTSKKRSKVYKLYDLVKMVISSYMIYLADIRSSIVSIAVFICFFCFSKLPRNRTTQFFKMLIYILLFFSSLLFIFNFDVNNLNILFSERFNYYQRAINDVIEGGGVLFGLGSFRNSDVIEAGKIQVDNSFIDIFYQYGLISLLFFIALIIRIFIELRRVGRKLSDFTYSEKNYYIFLNSFFSSVIVYSMVEKNLFSISSALSIVTFIFVFWYIEKRRDVF